MMDHICPALHRAGQLAPGMRGVALKAFRGAEQQSRHIKPCLDQQPRRHHAVAAVVAAATEHSDAPGTWEMELGEIRDGRGGRAHASRIDGTPYRSVVARSQACISAAERTCIATMVQDCRGEGSGGSYR